LEPRQNGMEHMRRMKTKRTGFTLIELLVVISIIGLLIGIVVPAVLGTLRSAKRARALSQIDDLNSAIKRYYAEYGKMPVPATHNGDMDRLYKDDTQAEVIEILIGANTNQNPREIVFLDLSPSSFIDASGDTILTQVEMLNELSLGNPYLDPWEEGYVILMDLDFTDRIDDLGYGEIRAKSAVCSGGEKKDLTNPPHKTW
jgi:prepilin-type N-terminal cleavage/methylation domain-containing protein